MALLKKRPQGSYCYIVGNNLESLATMFFFPGVYKVNIYLEYHSVCPLVHSLAWEGEFLIFFLERLKKRPSILSFLCHQLSERKSSSSKYNTFYFFGHFIDDNYFHLLGFLLLWADVLLEEHIANSAVRVLGTVIDFRGPWSSESILQGTSSTNIWKLNEV